MTIQELLDLGNEKPVLYRGNRVTFVCLTMRYVLGSTRKQPMKARIRMLWGRKEITVAPSQLSPVHA